jgi:hypothetical protein
MKTALAVYPHALRFDSFLAGSDAQLSFEPDAWREHLRRFVIAGRPVLDLSLPAHQAELERLVAMARPGPGANVEDRASLERRTSWATVITDDNMINEWGDWRRAPKGFERAGRPRGGRFTFTD